MSANGYQPPTYHPPNLYKNTAILRKYPCYHSTYPPQVQLSDDEGPLLPGLVTLLGEASVMLNIVIPYLDPGIMMPCVAISATL